MAQKIIQINKEKAQLSKPQKDFNRLIKKIEKLEREIVDYREGLTRLQQKIGTELMPARQTYFEQRAELVRCFDRAYDSGFFKKTELKKLAHLIVEMGYEAIEEGGIEDIVPIYDKYNEVSYEEESEQANQDASQQLKSLLEMMGLDIDDDIDLKNPDKFQAQMAEKMAEKQAQMEEEHRQAEERRAKRPKTQKQIEREEKKELEARNITKSVRTIYMDLVKAFHPDREPDTAERERKTQIMQRVTEAYEKNDLLALLRLQLEFERIDQDHIENLAESHLKNYNKLLREQSSELEGELQMLQSQAAMMSGQPPYMVGSIGSLQMALEMDIKQYKKVAKNIKHDLKVFESYDVLKAYLKSYKIPKPSKETSIFDMFF